MDATQVNRGTMRSLRSIALFLTGMLAIGGLLGLMGLEGARKIVGWK